MCVKLWKSTKESWPCAESTLRDMIEVWQSLTAAASPAKARQSVLRLEYQYISKFDVFNWSFPVRELHSSHPLFSSIMKKKVTMLPHDSAPATETTPMVLPRGGRYLPGDSSPLVSTTSVPVTSLVSFFNSSATFLTSPFF